MAEYSRVFGSQFPKTVMTLVEYKDIGEATLEEQVLIQEFYSYMDKKNFENASALLEDNWDILEKFYFGMEMLNKLEEELYNTQVYAQKKTSVIVGTSQPNATEYADGTVWLEPVD